MDATGSLGQPPSHEPSTDGDGGGTEWWPQFERDFEVYVRLGSTGERRDDSHRAS